MRRAERFALSFPHEGLIRTGNVRKHPMLKEAAASHFPVIVSRYEPAVQEHTDSHAHSRTHAHARGQNHVYKM